jgi:glucose-6-phosphate isomerase
MKVILDFCKDFIHKDKYKEQETKVLEAEKILDSRKGPGYDFLGWMDLPLSMKREELDHITQTADKIRKESDVLLVIGIGGSYLGARAAIEALKDVRNAEDCEVIFVGNCISGKYTESIIKYIENKDFSINVISKSGTTTEPAIAFRIFKEILDRKYEEDAAGRIYVTTDPEKGILRKMAQKEGYTAFSIPSDVGGRYSVLTACGLLPIAVAGLDINKMILGAAASMQDPDECIKYACIRNYFYNNGRTTEINVNYDPSLHYFTEWWKQLYGESEGKNGKGIFPAGVDFTSDLHSMGQYIQDGLRNIFETVVYVKNDHSKICIPYSNDNSDGLDYITGKSLQYVNSKAMQGTVDAHMSGHVPSIIIELDEMNEYNYGYLVYFFERACGISGYTLGVNPFDQPGVEAYKKNMFRLLGKPGI